MLPLPLRTTKAKLLWHDHCDQLLQASQSRIKTRVISQGPRAGNVEQVHLRRKPAAVKAKVLGTELICRAVGAIYGLRQLGLNAEQQEPLPAGVEISCNCVELARKMSCCEKKVRMHIKHLLEDGLVMEKKNHGWRRDLTLVISSAYLWDAGQFVAPIEEKIAPNIAVCGQHISQVLAENRNIFPPNEVQDTNPNQEIVMGEVEMLATPPQQRSGDTFAGDTGSRNERVAPKKRTRGGAGRGLAKKATPDTLTDEMAAAVEKQALLRAYVESFWVRAYQLLYPHKHFTAEQQIRAKEAIAQGVYRQLHSALSLAEWAVYHEQALHRLQLAANYFNRHTNKRVRWPYAEFVAGCGYFDQENAMGFVGTEAWRLKDEWNAYQRRVQYALDKAATEFQLFKQLRRGVKLKVCQRLREADAWSLYHYHEAKIKAAGGQRALNRFYNFTAASAGRANA